MQYLAMTFKRIFFLIGCSLIMSIKLSAQCTPNPSLFTNPGIEPDTMPVGYANNFYDENVYFMLPLDTQGFAYQNIEISSVVGLPIGMSWECDMVANGCNYVPANNQYGCIRLYGTPIQTGNFSAIVNITATLSVGIYPTTMSSPITILPDTSTGGGFNADITNGCLPVTVNFTNNNPGLMYYDWDFGNGNVSSLENPGPQTYTQEGVYIVDYKAWSDTNFYYILNSITITSVPDQSNYGTLVNDYDPDLYFILYDNNNVQIYQSEVIDDTQPPITYSIPNLNLSNADYELHLWDKDSGWFGLDPDDDLGVVPFNGYGGSGSASAPFSGGGNTAFDYSVTTIPPNFSTQASDTIYVHSYPTKPNVDSIGTNLSIDSSYYAMQWYKDGQIIAGASDSAHTASGTGYYHIVVKNENGCEIASDSIFIIVCNYFFGININVNGNVVWTDSTQYNFQWYYQGNPIPGAINNIYFADTSGYYYVVATDSFGCQSNSNPVFVDIPTDTTGISEISILSKHIKVFPNPSYGEFNIHFDMPLRSKHCEIEIYDQRGLLLQKETMGRVLIDDVKKIDISNYPSGIYVLNIRLEKGNINKRLIKH